MFKRAAIAVSTLIVTVNCFATTFYVVDGKLVGKAGEAKKIATTNPKAKVVKIQATEVQMNEETGNLKKSRDLTAAETKQAVNSLK
jgi:hypothetical protein